MAKLTDSKIAVLRQIASGAKTRDEITGHGRTINSIIESGLAFEDENGKVAITTEGCDAAIEALGDGDDRAPFDAAFAALGDDEDGETPPADACADGMTTPEPTSTGETVKAKPAAAAVAALAAFAAKRKKGGKGAAVETESEKPAESAPKRYRTARDSVRGFLASRCGSLTPRALGLEARDALADEREITDALADDGFSIGTIRAELERFKSEGEAAADEEAAAMFGEPVPVFEDEIKTADEGEAAADAIGEARRHFLDTLEELHRRAAELAQLKAATPAADLSATETELTEALATIEDLTFERDKANKAAERSEAERHKANDRAAAAEERAAKLEAEREDRETEIKRRSRRNNELEQALASVWREVRPSSTPEIVGAIRAMLDGFDADILAAIVEAIEANRD